MLLTNETKHQLKKGTTYYKAVFFDGEAGQKYVVGYATKKIEAVRAIDQWINANIDGGFTGLNSLDDMYIIEYIVVDDGANWKGKAVCKWEQENA